MYGFVLLNPLTIFGQGLYNIGTINDTIFTLLVYLIWTKQERIYIVAAALATYFDPRALFFVFPLFALLKFNKNQHSLLAPFLTLLAAIASVWVTLVSESQYKNAVNILMVNNPTENIGSFWYLMLESFPDKLEFTKVMYLLETLTMNVLTTFHIKKTFDVLELCFTKDAKVAQRKRESLLLNSFSLLVIIKFIMNPYPTLDDLTTCLFFTILDAKFILREIQALLLF